MEETFSINFSFIGKKEFKTTWQLLWHGKFNQDEALKQRKELYKGLIKTLTPRMKADGLKPTKSNIFHYWHTQEYKDAFVKIDDINDRLGKDNEECKKYIEILKKLGQDHI